MKVVVLNGSPKGEYSITLQTVLYWQKHFADDSFDVLQIGRAIKTIEKDPAPVLERLCRADLILFCYPVYTFLVPYQLHRFIELMKESGVDLRGKAAAQLSTSKHFFDMTAHRFIEENAGDMGLGYVGGLSADMDDLLKEKGQKEALDFWKYVRFCVKNGVFSSAKNARSKQTFYRAHREKTEKKSGFDTLILTNSQNDAALDGLIEDFKNVYEYGTRIINIADFAFSGGCLGCFRCASKGECVYRDGFQELLREDIQRASAIVYAFTVRDHSMGATFKRYDDRQFCNGHRQMTPGMPVGYLVNGNMAAEDNLRTLIEGRNEVAHTFLAGIVSGENADAELENMAKRLAYAQENRLLMPQNCYGVGGMKIFRDLIYTMKGLMKADHRFYKKNGVYDFPQKHKLTNLKMYALGALMSVPAVQKKMGNKMYEGMVAPYRKVLEKT